MENEEKVKKVVKDLVKKATVICKIDGTYAIVEAKTEEEKQKAISKQVKARFGHGVSGKVVKVVEAQIKKQLSELSVEEIQQVANLVVNNAQTSVDLKKDVTIENLSRYLTDFIIDKVVEEGNYSELLNGLDVNMLNEIKTVAEINQPKEQEELQEIVQGLEDKDVQEIKQKVYNGEGKYWKVLEEVDKAIALKSETKNI